MSDAPYTLDYDTLCGFCERQGLTFFTNEELQQLAIPSPERPGWAVRIVPRPDRGMVTLAYPLPGRIPGDRLDDLVVAANLLNARTFLGAWVVNHEAAEMYFRQTVLTQGVAYTDASVRELVQLVVGTAEMMIERLDAVLKGEAPEVVLEEPNA
ncbi:MAG: YbjN domain-containing protein [Myxococcota bacterium]